jgi:glc operon protein GlcG
LTAFGRATARAAFFGRDHRRGSRPIVLQAAQLHCGAVPNFAGTRQLISVNISAAARKTMPRNREEQPMKLSRFAAALFAAGMIVASQAQAQAPDLNAIPDKMPFNIPYGPPISAERAHRVIEEGIAEARRHGWEMNIAVVDPHGDLKAFTRMDDAQLASISIAQHKARTAARYRRETRLFEDLVMKGVAYIPTLDDVIASRGGIPLVEEGKLIGAVGCSGGTGSQDEAVCKFAASAVNR